MLMAATKRFFELKIFKRCYVKKDLFYNVCIFIILKVEGNILCLQNMYLNTFSLKNTVKNFLITSYVLLRANIFHIQILSITKNVSIV